MILKRIKTNPLFHGEKSMFLLTNENQSFKFIRLDRNSGNAFSRIMESDFHINNRISDKNRIERLIAVENGSVVVAFERNRLIGYRIENDKSVEIADCEYEVEKIEELKWDDIPCNGFKKILTHAFKANTFNLLDGNVDFNKLEISVIDDNERNYMVRINGFMWATKFFQPVVSKHIKLVRIPVQNMLYDNSSRQLIATNWIQMKDDEYVVAYDFTTNSYFIIKGNERIDSRRCNNEKELNDFLNKYREVFEKNVSTKQIQLSLAKIDVKVKG